MEAQPREGIDTVGTADAATVAREKLQAEADWAEIRNARGRQPRLSASELRRLRVLYVADRDDAPYRYRVEHGREQLATAGVDVDAVRLDDARLLSLVPSHSLVVLFRLPWSERVAELCGAARAAGVTLAYEVDDLVFDAAAAHAAPFLRRLPEHRQIAYARDFAAQRQTLEACDLCIAGTPAIATYARRLGKPAIVHPNLLAKTYERLSPVVSLARPHLLGEPLVGYMSGSDTHDGDLACIESALGRFLRLEPQARVALCGHLEPPPSLAAFGPRVVRIGYMDHRIYPWLIARCSALVAPLESVNDFVNAKSALKVFEANAFGVPVIASPSDPYLDAIREGESGFVARTEEEWLAGLQTLASRERSLAMGRSARALAMAEHSQTALAFVLAEKLLPWAGQGPAPKRAQRLRRVADRWLAHVRAASTLRSHARLGKDVLRMATRPLAELQAHRDAAGLRPSAFLGALLAERPGTTLLYHPHTPLESQGIGGARREPGSRGLTTGIDPWVLLTPDRPINELGAFGVELRATAAAPRGWAQVYWRKVGCANFSQEESVRFEVIPDGQMRTYVLDLRAGRGEVALGRELAITHLRFDPLDGHGWFELGRVAIAPAPEAFGLGATAATGVDVDVHVDLDVGVVSGGRPSVQILLSVDAAPERWVRSFESVLAHADGDWQLCLVASDDRTAQAAQKRADAIGDPRVRERVRVIRPQAALSQAGTASAVDSAPDFVILAAGTQVCEGFLRRLSACAAADPTAGMVLPLTADLLPDRVRNSGRDTPETLARLAAACALKTRPAVMTAAAPCLFLRHQLLRLPTAVTELAGDDAASVSAAVLLELVTSQARLAALQAAARAAGLVTRLADDVLVFPAVPTTTAPAARRRKGKDGARGGGTSAEDATTARPESSPQSHEDGAVSRELAEVTEVTDNLAFHVARRHEAARHAMLYILHASPFSSSPGGTEYHVLDLLSRLRLPRAVIGYPSGAALELAEILDGDVSRPTRYRLPLRAAGGRYQLENGDAMVALESACELFGIRAAHIHHMMFWPLSIGRALHHADVPYVVTCHDYYLACPSWNLINPATAAPCRCGEEPAAIEACMRGLFATLHERPPADLPGMRALHRRAAAALLANARAVIFPSAAARDLVIPRFIAPPARCEVIEHGYDVPGAAAPPAERGRDRGQAPDARGARRERLRLALIGAVGYRIKGAESYVALLAATRDLPVEWHIFGDAEVGGTAALLRSVAAPDVLFFHGAYARHEIVPKLREADIDLYVGLPAWDETFSFTLSEAACAGVPALVNDRGAPAARVRRDDLGLVVGDVEEAQRAIARLCAAPAELATLKGAVRAFKHRTHAESAADHTRLYEALGFTADATPAPPLREAALATLRRLRVAEPPLRPPSPTRPAAV